MSSYSLLLAFLLIIIYSPPTTANPLYYICGNTGNYAANSTFQSNLNDLLSSLSSSTPTSGFANSTNGSIPDRVHGLALCRGDVNNSNCKSCLDTATQDIMQLCLYTRSAVIWYNDCLLRYSNEIFFSSNSNQQEFWMCSTINATKMDRFDATVGDLMSAVSRWAVSNSSGALFATGEVNFTVANQTIYGLVQCTRDLAADECNQCLQGIIGTTHCSGRVGGRVVGSSCNYRYEINPFYAGTSKVVIPPPPEADATPPAAAPPAMTAAVPSPPEADAMPPAPAPSPMTTDEIKQTGPGKKKNNIGLVLGISIPVAAALVGTCILCICFYRRSSMKKLTYEAHSEEIESTESLLLDLSMLKVATNNFSESNKLGEGGFGAVYKGLLHDGRVIAVKRLATNSNQGLQELKNELVFVAKLQHRNLVKLVGVCLEEQEKLVVYQYVPNKSLDTFLFDPMKRGELYWERRYKIIEGITRGLLYLHEDSQLKIIHRDLKASNILLDADMTPKISDFGLARLFGRDQTQTITSRVVGTYGYMAPECVLQGQFSIKSDVYSFGVLVLEIVTGRKNSGFVESEQHIDLISYTWDHWTKGTAAEVVDPSLGQHWPRSEVVKCIQIGLLCVQEDPSERPTMSSILVMLNSNSVTLQAPSRHRIYSNMASEELGISGSTHRQSTTSNRSPMSVNEVSISELEGR